MTQSLAAVRTVRPYVLAALAVPLAVLLWAYWTALGDAADRWADDPLYSHGYLVPGFAALLLWLRRGKLTSTELRPSWWGLAILAAAAATRLLGIYFHFEYLDPLSLVPSLVGALVLLAGWGYLRWAWPSIAFLFFMLPLPFSVSEALAGHLQLMATEASTFLLQTLGRPAVAEGTLIHLNEGTLNVEQACSGLRMLMIFFALSTAVALLMRKPLWERLVVCASAVPIALLTNLLRITATGLLHDTAGKEVADAVFHDLAGWLMMPVALAFLGLELKLLGRLLVVPPPAAPALAGALPPMPMPAAAAPPPEKPAAAPRQPRRQRQARAEVAQPFSRR
jgi:exosortase